jgi:hypothetical protein
MNLKKGVLKRHFLAGAWIDFLIKNVKNLFILLFLLDSRYSEALGTYRIRQAGSSRPQVTSTSPSLIQKSPETVLVWSKLLNYPFSHAAS